MSFSDLGKRVLNEIGAVYLNTLITTFRPESRGAGGGGRCNGPLTSTKGPTDRGG